MKDDLIQMFSNTQIGIVETEALPFGLKFAIGVTKLKYIKFIRLKLSR